MNASITHFNEAIAIASTAFDAESEFQATYPALIRSIIKVQKITLLNLQMTFLAFFRISKDNKV